MRILYFLVAIINQVEFKSTTKQFCRLCSEILCVLVCVCVCVWIRIDFWLQRSCRRRMISILDHIAYAVIKQTASFVTLFPSFADMSLLKI